MLVTHVLGSHVDSWACPFVLTIMVGSGAAVVALGVVESTVVAFKVVSVVVSAAVIFVVVAPAVVVGTVGSTQLKHRVVPKGQMGPDDWSMIRFPEIPSTVTGFDSDGCVNGRQ